MDSDELRDDINAITAFLSCRDIPDITQASGIDCLVLCASQLLIQAETVFTTLETNPTLAKCVVLVGGKGHSTDLIYDQIARHPKYSSISSRVRGLPEARVLEVVLDVFFDRDRMTAEGCKVLLEDRSTNCGANAIETKKVLENAGMQDMKRFVVVQDPTMLLRTIKSFDKAYEDASTAMTFEGCPIFVPQVKVMRGELEYDVQKVEARELWEKQRFFELLAGEIPRLRDDDEGYGPRGRGFISHVEVPERIEIAAERVGRELGLHRRT